MDVPFVTIIVPCRNEEGHIRRCLECIVRTEHPHERLEALVVDGRSTDRTREIVAAYAARYPWIRLLDNPRRITPCAMNVGIQAAKGEIIIRMDAHASYPSNYVTGLIEALELSGADNVGGRMITVPGAPGAVGRAIAHALAHPFGVGNARFRIGAREPRWVDTVQFGCYRREVFERIGMFDEELVRNQDDELNYRLSRSGGRILLTPHVELHYYARPTLRLLGRMYFQYGRFKPLVARKVGKIMTVRQLVPALFIVALALGVALAPFSAPAAQAVLLGVLAYALLAVVSAAASVRRIGWRAALALPAAFAAMHFSYGWGYLVGLRNLAASRRRAYEAAAIPLSR